MYGFDGHESWLTIAQWFSSYRRILLSRLKFLEKDIVQGSLKMISIYEKSVTEWYWHKQAVDLFMTALFRKFLHQSYLILLRLYLEGTTFLCRISKEISCAKCLLMKSTESHNFGLFSVNIAKDLQ